LAEGVYGQKYGTAEAFLKGRAGTLVEMIGYAILCGKVECKLRMGKRPISFLLGEGKKKPGLNEKGGKVRRRVRGEKE